MYYTDEAVAKVNQVGSFPFTKKDLSRPKAPPPISFQPASLKPAGQLVAAPMSVATVSHCDSKFQSLFCLQNYYLCIAIQYSTWCTGLNRADYINIVLKVWKVRNCSFTQWKTHKLVFPFESKMQNLELVGRGEEESMIGQDIDGSHWLSLTCVRSNQQQAAIHEPLAHIRAL
jgi:hypothetical protein